MNLLLLVIVCISLVESLTPSVFLTTSDKARLKQVLNSAWVLEDIPAVHYAVNGYKLLAEKLTISKEICTYAQAAAKEGGKSLKPETAYHLTGITNSLSDCSVTFSTAVQSGLDGVFVESPSVSDIYYAVFALKSMKASLDSPKILKALTAALKKDDSVINLGYAFHVASILKGDRISIFERIEDAIVQADEVNGKFLQFEGGLSVTALIISGAYELGSSLNQAPTISSEQAIKFSNYFLSRKSVQTVKGTYLLLKVLTIFTTNKFHVPVSISLASPLSVSVDAPSVSVRITNLLGAALGPLKVTADSATRIGDEAVVMDKTPFTPVNKDPSVYELNIMSSGPSRGFYVLSVSAFPVKADPSLIGNEHAAVTVKVLTSVKLQSVEVGVTDTDQSTQPQLHKVVYPVPLDIPLSCDHHQKLLLSWSLRDERSGDLMAVHQAFVRLTNTNTQQEIIFVAEADSKNIYNFDIDVNAKAKEFGSMSGTYSIHLIIGDPVITNSFSWSLGKVHIKFGEDAPSRKDHSADYKPRPIIQHMFREPEKRPPTLVSNAFTILVILPLLLLFVLWGKLGVNLSNFPFSLHAIGFHAGLGSIFCLFVLFWLKLNMFTTLKYLACLTVVTFLCGNRLLAKIAADRK